MLFKGAKIQFNSIGETDTVLLNGNGLFTVNGKVNQNKSSNRECNSCMKISLYHADCKNCNLELCEFCGFNCSDCGKFLCNNCINLL